MLHLLFVWTTLASASLATTNRDVIALLNALDNAGACIAGGCNFTDPCGASFAPVSGLNSGSVNVGCDPFGAVNFLDIESLTVSFTATALDLSPLRAVDWAFFGYTDGAQGTVPLSFTLILPAAMQSVSVGPQSRSGLIDIETCTVLTDIVWPPALTTVDKLFVAGCEYHESRLTNLAAPLQTIGSFLEVGGINSLQTVSLPSLSSVGEDCSGPCRVQFVELLNLVSISLPKLQQVAVGIEGGFGFLWLPALIAVDLSSLQSITCTDVKTTFQFLDVGLQSLSFPSLTLLSCDVIQIEGNPNLQTIDAPVLTQIGFVDASADIILLCWLDIEENPVLGSVNFPSLSIVFTDLKFIDNPLLAAIDLSSIKQLGTPQLPVEIVIKNNGVESLVLPAIATYYAGLVIFGNNKLTSIVIPDGVQEIFSFQEVGVAYELNASVASKNLLGIDIEQNNALRSVYISQNLTSIRGGGLYVAFNPLLTSLTVPGPQLLVDCYLDITNNALSGALFPLPTFGVAGIDPNVCSGPVPIVLMRKRTLTNDSVVAGHSNTSFCFVQDSTADDGNCFVDLSACPENCICLAKLFPCGAVGATGVSVTGPTGPAGATGAVGAPGAPLLSLADFVCVKTFGASGGTASLTLWQDANDDVLCSFSGSAMSLAGEGAHVRVGVSVAYQRHLIEASSSSSSSRRHHDHKSKNKSKLDLCGPVVQVSLSNGTTGGVIYLNSNLLFADHGVVGGAIEIDLPLNTYVLTLSVTASTACNDEVELHVAPPTVEVMVLGSKTVTTFAVSQALNA